MSYGSNIAVEDAEDEYREETARIIAMHAAELVAASGKIGDRPRFPADPSPCLRVGAWTTKRNRGQTPF